MKKSFSYITLAQNGQALLMTKRSQKENKHKEKSLQDLHITNFESFWHDLSPKVLKTCPTPQGVYNINTLQPNKHSKFFRHKYWVLVSYSSNCLKIKSDIL